MAEKPVTLPLWATNALTTVEPSLGQKQAGWAVNTKPPARWMNWQMNLVYTWIQYLDAPVGTGAGAGLAATGGSSGGIGLQGTGGATSGIGVHGAGTGSGHGVTGQGGATGQGGVFTGGAGGLGTGCRGTGGAGGGVGVIGTGTGNQPGVSGFGGPTNGNGVTGLGTANGSGGVFTGAGNGTGVAGTGGGTTSGTGVTGTGGAPNGRGGTFQGTGTGTGAQGTGGTGSNAHGLVGVGGSTSGAGVVGTATASGLDGVRGTGAGGGSGVLGTGGGSNGTGVYGLGGATNGNGVRGEGTGTGIGVEAVATNGYGVWAESDTTSPLKAALRMVPQNADPSSSPAKGDIYFHTTNGKPRFHNGTAFERSLTQDGESNADSSSVSGSITETAFDVVHNIPAGTLMAGSTIRVRALIAANSLSSNRFDYRLRIGGVAGTLIALFPDIEGYPDSENPSDLPILIDAVISVREAGASADIVASTFLMAGLGSETPTQSRMYGVVTNMALTINTTIANDVTVTVDNTTGGAGHVLASLVVDIA